MSEQDRTGWTCFLTTFTEGRGRRRSSRVTHRPAVVVTFDGEPTDLFALRKSATDADAQQALADVEAAIATADAEGFSLRTSIPLLHMRPDESGALLLVEDADDGSGDG